MRFKQGAATAAAIAVVVVVGGGAAAYELTARDSHATGIDHSAGQAQVKVADPSAQPSSSSASSSPSASPSPSHSHHARHKSSSSAPTRRSSSPPASTPAAPPPPPAGPRGSYNCNYGPDTWSGDASSVGYSVQKISASDGKKASFSVRLNANRGTTEVVGYPSDQCLIYTALPGSLTSSYSVTPPANSSGLDYEFAYDIWLTSASAASSNNWNNDLELMIWTYVNGQRPAGSKVASLSDGSAVWFAGTKGNNNSTVSVVLPSNTTSGTVHISSIVAQLKSLGYVPSSDTGILDVEYGIEAPYGGGNTFAVNGFSATG